MLHSSLVKICLVMGMQILLTTSLTNTKGASNEGNEFYLIMPPNKGRLMDPELYISTREHTPVIFNVSWVAQRQQTNQQYSVQSGHFVKIVIPSVLEIRPTTPFFSTIAITVKAESNRTLIVYGISEEFASTDSWLALPKVNNKLGIYEYFAVSTKRSIVPSVINVFSFLGIVTTEDNTTIQVTPVQNVLTLFGRYTTLHKGKTYTHTYDKGYSVAMTSEDEITGTRIVANKPLTVISGHQCGTVPYNYSACDVMVEHIPSTDTWGFTFILVPLRLRTKNGFSFIASRAETLINIHCNNQAGNRNHKQIIKLKNAGSQKVVIYPTSRYCFVKSNLPILVMQYALGHSTEHEGTFKTKSDPFMVTIPPTEQYSNELDVYLFDSLDEQTGMRRNQFNSWINLVVMAEHFQSSDIRINRGPLSLNSTAFTPIHCEGDSICAYAAQLKPNAETGPLSLTHVNPQAKCAGTVYGWEIEHTYGCSAGFKLDSVAITTYCLGTTKSLVFEKDGRVKFPMYRTGIATEEECLDYTIIPQTAREGSDYVGTNGTCCFAANDKLRQCTVQLVEDAEVEADETFLITLRPIDHQFICEENTTLEVTVSDAERLIFSLDSDTYRITEDSGRVRVGVVRREGAWGYNMTMIVKPLVSSVSKSSNNNDNDDDNKHLADPNADFVTDSLKAHFTPNGPSTVYVEVPITRDETFEYVEHFTVELQLGPESPEDAQLAGLRSATVFITDRGNVLGFEQSHYTAPEGREHFNAVRLQAEQPFAARTAVDIQALDQTASSSDFAVQSHTVVFHPGQTYSTSLNLTVLEDSILEGREQFALRFTLPEGYVNLDKGTTDTGTVFIEDNDHVQVGFVKRMIAVPEQTPHVAVELEAIGHFSVPIAVSISANDLSASISQDYTFDNGQLLTFEPGVNRVQTLVYIIDDGIMEGPQSFRLALSIPTPSSRLGVVLGELDMTLVEIQDNDDIRVQFTQSEYTAAEGEGVVQVTMEALGEFEGSFEVPIQIRDSNGTGDSSATTLVAIFNSGQNGSKFASVLFEFPDNDVVEEDKVLELSIAISQLSHIRRVREGPQRSSFIRTTNDDGLQVFFQSSSLTVHENASSVELIVEASSAAAVDYELVVGTVQANATGGADYEPGPYRVLVKAGSNAATLSLPITDDDLFESGVERFTVVLRTTGNAGRLGVSVLEERDSASIYIVDDDDLLVQFAQPIYQVVENDPEVVVSLETDKQFEYPFMVAVETTSLSATGSLDYAEGPFTVHFTPNATTALLPVAILADVLCERREMFTLVVLGPPLHTVPTEGSRIAVGGLKDATVWILDDDVVTVNFTQSSHSVPETDASLSLELFTMGECDHSFQTVVEVSSQSESLHYLQGQHTVTFEPGQVSASVQLLLSDDHEFQCERAVEAAILMPVYATEDRALQNSQPAAVSISVEDNDEFVVQFEKEEYVFAENASTAQVCLLARRDCNSPLTVHIRTEDDLAKSGLDYVGGTLPVEFPAGATEACVGIQIIDDRVFEGQQSFGITILIPDGVRARSVNTARVTIEDNDDVFCTLMGDTMTVMESQRIAKIYIVPSIDIEEYFMCDFQTSSLTAKDGFDFDSVEGRMMFTPDANHAAKEYLAKYLEIPIVDDYVREPSEAFRMIFFDEHHQLAPLSGTISILDDDDEVTEVQCTVQNSLQIAPFQSANSYLFPASCEHSLVSTACGDNSTVTPFSVHLDFQGNDLSQTTLAIRWANSTAVLFPDSRVETHNAELKSEKSDVTVFGSGLRVFRSGQNITLELFELGIQVVKVLSPEVSYSISIATTSVVADHLCGLCGDSSGVLLQGDSGEVLHLTTATDAALKGLFAHFSIPASIQLTPNRRACSDVTNDTVVGDPLFTVPVTIASVPAQLARVFGDEYSICYEIKGQHNMFFNLVSDTCVSINAFYQQSTSTPNINVIGRIGVVSRNAFTNEDTQISVQLEGCRAFVNNSEIELLYADQKGILMQRRLNRVRISVPNCNNVDLVVWVVCEKREGKDMIKFVVSRGHNVKQTSHGLIGQFWNVALTIEDYKTLEDEVDESYLVTLARNQELEEEGARGSLFTAELHAWSWDERQPCLFAGNSEGGKPMDATSSKELVKTEGGVIEGNYQDYIVSDLFAVDFKYSRFITTSDGDSRIQL